MKLALGVLALVHVLAALANFVAPYEPEQQHREHPWAAPGWSGPVRLLHRDPNALHLFGVDAPGKIFLLGTDGLGRDQFSRLLHGARISLFSGLLAAVLSAAVGVCLGGAAGFYGGRTDWLIMRLAEFFLALPWTYLLLAARAFFPLNADPRTVFLSLLVILGVIGWARPARLVRGITLSVKERDYVLAARGFGASAFYILRRHILPETLPAISTYVALAIPQFVLAETTLTFLGLGFGGDSPSWGSLLAALSHIYVISEHWWMIIPAILFAGIFACYTKIASRITGAAIAQ